MDLSVRLGRSPLWAHSLPRDELEAVMAWDWCKLEQRNRAAAADKRKKLLALGNRVPRG
jgi:hypothetical protein